LQKTEADVLLLFMFSMGGANFSELYIH